MITEPLTVDDPRTETIRRQLREAETALSLGRLYIALDQTRAANAALQALECELRTHTKPETGE